MPKIKQRTHCLLKKNSSRCSPLKAAERTSYLSVSKSRMFVHRRRKRKIGVTLLTALKKKRAPVAVVPCEAVTHSSPKVKQMLQKNSNKFRSYPDWNVSLSSSSIYETTDCIMPDVTDDYAETTVSSPIIIDDSSDVDCSSAADVTNDYNTSAISNACNDEDVDDFAAELDGVIHGQG